jgi:hypothetical protein
VRFLEAQPSGVKFVTYYANVEIGTQVKLFFIQHPFQAYRQHGLPLQKILSVYLRQLGDACLPAGTAFKAAAVKILLVPMYNGYATLQVQPRHELQPFRKFAATVQANIDTSKL